MKTFDNYKLYIIGTALLFVLTASVMDVKTVTRDVKNANNTHFVISQEDNLTLRDSLVTFAQSLLGTPYVYGSCNKDGFDCSGFVYYVFKHFEIDVPRTSSQYEDFGDEIPIEKVQKGDILVFLSPTRNAIGHLGIVVKANGKESEFIHATSGKAMRVVETSLTNEGYTKRFVKAVRVL